MKWNDVDNRNIQAEDLGYNIVDVIRVPGCMEIPLALDRVLSDEDIAGAFCLGIIEKGETDHGLVMGQGLSKPSSNCNWFTTSQSVWESLDQAHFQNM